MISHRILPLEEHPDFERVVQSIPSYYLTDQNGKVRIKKGKPVKNDKWEEEAVGYWNPFFVEAAAAIRALHTEHPRLDGRTDTTILWVDFRCPKENQLPLIGELSFQYGPWSDGGTRYCYVSVEWSKP